MTHLKAPRLRHRKQRRKRSSCIPCLKISATSKSSSTPSPSLVLFAVLFSSNSHNPPVEACPSECSNHGYCISTAPFDCICDNGWQGPDCRERTCPVWKPWAGRPTADDIVHTWENKAECAGRGVCDRESGLCECDAGFTGNACQIMDCAVDADGNVCHGNGQCVSMGTAAAVQDLTALYEQTSYDAWDSHMIYGCICDEFYSGFDCSVRVCPYGDDPLTIGQYSEVQVLDCVCDVDPCDDSSFTFTYAGVTSNIVAGDATLANLELELDALRTLNGGVDVTITGDSDGSSPICGAAGVSTAINFNHNGGDLIALLPNVVQGSASLTMQISGAVGSYDSLLASRDGTTEFVECSGRGICDRDTGYCNCFEDFSSSDGSGNAGNRGDCGYFDKDTVTLSTSKHCPREDKYWASPFRAFETPQWGEICYGHGTCGYSSSFVCECQGGYTGRYCQRPACSKGSYAWFDEATATDTAHSTGYVCSNRGTCNEVNGICECAEGFEGQACQRLSCPGGSVAPCSSHGRCLTQADYASFAEDNNGDTSGFSYTTQWDADMIQLCDCDVGYNGDWGDVSGFDCSSIVCPKGRDPHDTQGNDEVQILTCTHSTGSFTLKSGTIVSQLVSVDSSLSDITSALQNFGAEVTFTNAAFTAACDPAYVSGEGIQLTFTSQYGDLDPVEFGGNFDLAGGSFSVSTLTDGTTVGYECSNRGICDRSTGLCSCFTGYCSSNGENDFGIGTRGDCSFRDIMCSGSA